MMKQTNEGSGNTNSAYAGGMVKVFEKMTKTDIFYIVVFGLSLVFLYFSMVNA